MAIGQSCDFLRTCTLQRLHRWFFLPHPINTKPICDDIEPPGKLVVILERREFLICLEKGVLRNFFGVVKIANLPPHQSMDVFLVFLNQGAECRVVA